MREDERELLDAYRDLVKLQLDEIDNLETMIYLRCFILQMKRAED